LVVTGTYELAALPQQTINRWHDFVASGDPARLSPLLAENIVFRSPFVQTPIAGHAATLLMINTVVQIFENFRYHRTLVAGPHFVAGPHDVALESAPMSINGSSRAST